MPNGYWGNTQDIHEVSTKSRDNLRMDEITKKHRFYKLNIGTRLLSYITVLPNAETKTHTQQKWQLHPY